MKKLSLVIAYFIGQGLLFAPAANANLLTNGSFEDGNYNNTIDGYPADFVRLSTGATDITGWVVGGDGLDWHVLDGKHAHFGPSADGGHFGVDLSLDYSPVGSISQTFATSVGTHYELSFLLGAPMFDTAVDVTVAGMQQRYSLLGNSQYGFPWMREMLKFTAVGDSTTLTFGGVAGGYSGGYWGPIIDSVNIDISPVPEPETLSFLGAGLAVLVLRRKKQLRLKHPITYKSPDIADDLRGAL